MNIQECLVKMKQLGMDEDTGDYPTHSFPGLYPIIYFAADAEVVCPECANDDDFHVGSTDDGHADQFELIASEAYMEGPTIQCCHCDKMIESAYGDPEKEGK